MTTDYLIIGQGIAGTLLAHFLMKEGKTVAIVDNPEKSSSSSVAGGIYNPVVFKRMAKSWKADTLVPFAIDTYRSFEQDYGVNPLWDVPVMKIFANEGERKLWLQIWNHGEMDDYITNEMLENPYEEYIYSPLGASVVLRSGAVDVNKVREAIRTTLGENYIKADFHFKDLQLKNDEVEWKGVSAQKVIFCEGYLGNKNPYFPDLPLRQTKGEVLIIEIPDFQPKHIINRGCFILPLGNGLFKVGATFEWQDINETPTSKGREELEDKMKSILKVPYKIVDQQAGVRPTVLDRRPLIGIHSKHPQIGIFNGLGTKGIMLAPYFANEFVQHMIKGKPLTSEVSIARFA